MSQSGWNYFVVSVLCLSAVSSVSSFADEGGVIPVELGEKKEAPSDSSPPPQSPQEKTLQTPHKKPQPPVDQLRGDRFKGTIGFSCRNGMGEIIHFFPEDKDAVDQKKYFDDCIEQNQRLQGVQPQSGTLLERFRKKLGLLKKK